ncbi:MAG: hypothetical protein CFH26_00582 [Alphaproteobacteria bacterium MarineAlpha6_Bin4]|nr:MAG: hypothetical protein CFH27_00025 [Alphaproteobacteria bacterium MarineAlpha6_Bin5]PPR37713.1 MAG: hypothetical protein CFH26_00582 [Alphaproteobacteria bacterium MarineAlpha6_Bin4]|tara:strand:+ start:6770 stop:7168 length:399 start_codon:yes stop_codon:yes gene_type:complete
MVEKKENSKNFDIKNFGQYFDILKKYLTKLLQLDAKTYFFIVPGILLLVGLLPVPDIYFAILRIYLFVSALVLTYKFYIDEKDNIYAAIFAGIAVIYNPIFFIKFGNSEINTGPIIFVLTIALFVLGYKKIE